MMHNWIEGVLQHHARVKWGIGQTITPESKNDIVTLSSSSHPDDFIIDMDVDMLNDELDALQAESQQYEDTPLHLKRLQYENSLLSSDVGSNDSDDEDFCPDNESDEDNISDSETVEKTVCIFDPVTLSKIHACLSDAVVPSWIDRPPTNLGDKSHGKLKADEWLLLFTIFLPLILPEIWLSSYNQKNVMLLDNFHDLVTCTNIVCSHSVSAALADKYLDHYIKYRKSSKLLFPNVNSRPNHHYAMHNADLMKFWGPLIKISEFPYERHNGTLQKIKTNRHICKTNIY
jgi:hypothetical protein